VRLPFPERIPLTPALGIIGLLGAVQLLERTDPLFCLGSCAFLIISVLAFNVAGGFSRPSGGYIFFFSVLTAGLGLFWKAILGEAAQSNLVDPLLTIRVYVAGISMMFLSGLISRTFSAKRGLMANMVNDSNMQTATVGCTVAGIAMIVAGSFLPGGSGSVISALSQLNRFLYMAIILGVIHTIRRSGGRRSINIPVLISGFVVFADGILGYSKEGILAPIFCWLVAAASQRYKLTRVQILSGILAIFFIFQYLVPYAQYGREYRGNGFLANLQVSISLLSDLGRVRQEYLDVETYTQESGGGGYYDTPQGFLNRLQELSIEDALIAHTAEFGPIGFWPIIIDIDNMVPHFIWANKPALQIGNFYAHELGILAEDDVTTGISFSPVSEAFHIATWKGIFLLAPALWTLLFLQFDSLCGDTRKSPWGLLAIVAFAHAAPEYALDGIFYSYIYLAAAIIFAAVIGTYLMPIVGTLFIGPEGIRMRRGAPILPIPKRVPSVSSQQG
jgi:hypothetical protein